MLCDYVCIGVCYCVSGDMYHVKVMIGIVFGGTIVRNTSTREAVHTGIASYGVVMWIVSNQCD